MFIGSCSGNFYALDKISGKVKWSYDITKDGNQTSFHGDMLITDELVIIGTDGGNAPTGIGHVYAFERKNGRVRWKHFAGRGVTSDILRLGSKIYAVTLKDELLCLDLNTGEVSWKFASKFTGFNGNLSDSPAVAGDTVFFGGMDGSIYALDAGSGEVIWKSNFESPIASSLLIREDGIYLGTEDRHFYRLDRNTGALSASFAVEAPAVGKPVMVDSLLVFFPGRGRRLGVAQDLVCLDLAVNKIRWRQEVLDETSITLQPGLKLEASGEDNSCAAELVWSTPYPYLRQTSVLAGNSHGGVAAFDITNGREIWSRQLTGAIRSFAEAEGVLYVGTVEGIIYALDLEGFN